MTFKSNYQKSSSRAQSGSNSGGLIVGGSITTLLLMGVVFFLGGDPQLVGNLGQILQSPNSSFSSDQGSLEHCQTGEDANTYDDCRIEFTAISLDGVWSTLLPTEVGVRYTEPNVVIFSRAVNTACGTASSASGPFYCPADQTAYFDTSFFQQLKQLGGSDGPFSQQYVVAHEFGHHLQNLQNTLRYSNYNQPGEDSNAVKIELQADCYAGVWAAHADKGPEAIMEPLTEQQISQAIITAQAIGDDNIQRASGRRVNSHEWTHGSSEQREQAFLRGYNSGNAQACAMKFR